MILAGRRPCFNWATTLAGKAARRNAARSDQYLHCVFSSSQPSRRLPDDGLSFGDFLKQTPHDVPPAAADSLDHVVSFHIKTYGCQMNVNDSDIVRSLLLDAGLKETLVESEATVLLTNTCAIREGAEAKVWQRLRDLRSHYTKKYSKKHKKRRNHIVGVLGCMAERLKEDLFQDGLADLVVGPDAYRDLPNLIRNLLVEDQENAVNVQLSMEETYADITPVRKAGDSDVAAFVSIQRGCSNHCSFCIVPFTRGHERSRPLDSIVSEIQNLYTSENIKEVTLLGQNVNSYHDRSQISAGEQGTGYQLSNAGFRSRIRRADDGYFFADLLAAVSDISPELRVRFTSPHPKDYPKHLLQLMAERPNICKHLHMPAQSGSTTMLKRMKRGYTREAYLELMEDVHSMIPDVAVSSDFITGFCGETEEEHNETLSLMELVRYDQAFMFAYSMREKTHAHRTMQDDVPEEVKQRRLREIIDVFQKIVQEKNTERELGRLRLVLVEGESKRSQPGSRKWHGRTDQNKRIIFPIDESGPMCVSDESIGTWEANTWQFNPLVELKVGDYAVVEVTEAKGHTLRGRLLWRSTLSGFSRSGLSGVDSESLVKAKKIRQ